MTEFFPQTLVDYAQIVGALATSAAVIVSLSLASRKPKPELRVSCNIGTLLPQQLDALQISVVNEGNITATIQAVDWVFYKKRWWQDNSYKRILNKKRLRQFGSSKGLPGLGSSLPSKIAHGEQASFFQPLQGEYDWKRNLEYFREDITSRGKLESLRVVVSTSVDTTFFCKPAERVLNMIWKHLQDLRAQKQADKT